MVIEFKSVGEPTTARRLQPVVNEIPIGIKTPLRLGDQNDGIFSMHFNLAKQIHDNFRNLLLTNHGERLGQFNFGANLRELSLELGRDDFDSEAVIRIRGAINSFMPFIEPKTFESSVITDDLTSIGKVLIKITYDVPRLNIANKGIGVIIFVGG